MEELRQSNQELLKSLQIGQKKAWDILRNVNTSAKPPKSLPDVIRPYTFSTPKKAYLELLDKAGNERYSSIKLSSRENIPLTNYRSPLVARYDPNTSSSTLGRPHKPPGKARGVYPQSEGPHSPLCTEDHRATLHRKLNDSYSKLAADLREIAPYYGADLVYGLGESHISVTAKPDSYYEDIKKFRMANSEECSVRFAEYNNKDHDTSRSRVDKENSGYVIEEKPHQCVQTYTVGSGYRAKDAHSCTQCPLCIGADDTKHRGLIRVNIPHDQLVDYTLSKGGNNLDSVSLSSHCLAGWEQTQNTGVPAQRGNRSSFRY